MDEYRCNFNQFMPHGTLPPCSLDRSLCSFEVSILFPTNGDLFTVIPLYSDIRYNFKTCCNDKLNRLNP